MRVLFLTEWFDPLPAQKGLSFVSGLRDAGLDIDVATTFPMQGPMSAYRRDTMNGITVHRLPFYRSHDASGVRRSLTYLTFLLSLLAFGIVRGRRYDVIYAYHPPITVGLAAALFGGLWRRPFVLDVLDLWPDVVTESGMARPGAVKLIDRMCGFVYRRAVVISVASQGFKRRLIERGVPASKIECVYNFADERQARASGRVDLAPYGMKGRFNIVYGGNFGVFQDLGSLIAAARLAHARDARIQLILLGTGSDADNVRRAAAQAPDAVRVHPPVPGSEIGDVFDAADLLVLHLADRPIFRIYLPGKLGFYFAMGKPVLAGLSGEGAEIVEAAGAGFVVPPGDVEAIADGMLRALALDPPSLDVMGRSGREFYDRNMSSTLATERLLEMLTRAARGHAALN